MQVLHHELITDHAVWDDRIEVAYLSVIALKTYRRYRSKIGIISPGEPFHVKEAGNDWLMNWYFVRELGVTMYGPSPKTLIDPITKEELLRAVREHAEDWREYIKHVQSRGSQAYAILTLCRALCTLKKGALVSKKQAALWAEKEFTEWSSLITNAVLWCIAPRGEQADHEATLPETHRFVDFAIRECEQAAH